MKNSEMESQENTSEFVKTDLDNVLRFANVPVYIVKAEKVVYISPKAEELLGYSLEDIPSVAAWFNNVYDDKNYREMARRMWENSLKGITDGEIKPQIFKVLCRNGENKFLKIKAIVNSTKEIYIHFEEVQKHYKTQNSLKEQVDISLEIYNNMYSGLYIYHLENPEDDHTLKMLACNPAGEKMTGFLASDLIGKYIDEIFPALREQDIPRIYADVVRTGVQAELTVPFQGNQIYLVKAFPLPAAKVGISFEEVSEKYKFEKKLKDVAEVLSTKTGKDFFNTLVEKISQTLDVETVFIAQMTEGENLRTLSLYNSGKFLTNVEYAIKGTPCEKIIQEGIFYVDREILLKYPGQKLLELFSAESYLGISLKDSMENVNGVIVIMSSVRMKQSDFNVSFLKLFAQRSAAEIERNKYITELKAAKKQAEKADRLKTEFLAQMSHEIRTPVNAILSFTSLIKEEVSGNVDSEFLSSFEIIANAGDRIIRTIDLILNMSEIQTGNFKLNPVKLNLSENVISSLVREMTAKAKEKKLELIFEKGDFDHTLVIDRYTITQILANLLDNSIKYTKQGEIKISTKRNPGEMEVLITDTGIGISPEYQERIFEPFSQEEQGYTRKYEGNGLGLALVKKFCDLNSIKITLDSEKGKGSCFRIIIPLTE